MLGNTGDELTNMWGLIGAGLAVAGLGFAIPNRIWRAGSWGIGGLLVLSGLGWSIIRAQAPAVGVVVAELIANPSNWLLLIAFSTAVLWLRQWRLEITNDVRREVERAISENPELKALKVVPVTETASPVEETATKPELIDWALWRKRQSYTVRELSRIFAGENPVGAKISDKGVTIQRLIFEGMKMRSLPYTPVPGKPDPGFDCKIKREDAVFWGRHFGLDVSHIDDPVATAASKGKPSTNADRAKASGVNWDIWCQKRSYTVRQLARALAFIDPQVSAKNADADAYMALLIDDVLDQKIPYSTAHGNSRITRDDVMHNEMAKDAIIKKADALAWGKDRGCYTDHLVDPFA